MGAAFEQQEHDLVTAVVDAVIRMADGGTLTRADVNQVLDNLDVPASRYRAVLDAISSRGLVVSEPDEVVSDRSAEANDGSASDGFGLFVQQTRHRVLTMAEEQALGARIERGRLASRFIDAHGTEVDAASRRDLERQIRDGRSAEDELAQHNIRLVISLAAKMRGRCTPGLDFEDLIQEGYLGLATAISKWEHERLLKFSTYATWWIRQRMQRAIADKASTIRLPVHVRDSLRTILHAEWQLIASGDKPTARAIAEATGLPLSRVHDLLRWRARVDSLDRVITSGDIPLGSLLPDQTRGDSAPEGAAMYRSLCDAIDQVLGELSAREQDVLRRRFGLGEGGAVQTLEEIGAAYGLTRERIRQVEAKALKKLRASPRRDRLRDFITTEADG